MQLKTYTGVLLEVDHTGPSGWSWQRDSQPTISGHEDRGAESHWMKLAEQPSFRMAAAALIAGVGGGRQAVCGYKHPQGFVQIQPATLWYFLRLLLN